MSCISEKAKRSIDISTNGSIKTNLNLEIDNTEQIKQHFEPILKLATEICSVPFSVVNLVDKIEQKTLATYGDWDNQEISNIQDICGKLGSKHGVRVINNIRENPEIITSFSDRDLDTTIFYAGAPLISKSGSRLGTLCVFDSEQRHLTESQKECLAILADEIVMKLHYFEQKETASAVLKLKKKFQKVVDVATDLIYELEWDSGNMSWGDELTDILGYPNEERFVDYDWWLDKIHPDDLERVVMDVSTTVEGKSDNLKLVYRIRTNDGTYKHVMNHNYIDRKEDGTPDNIIGAIVDISDLKEAEASAERKEKLLEELADYTSTAIWIRDHEGKHLYLNQNYKSLFGLGKTKTIGKTVYELFDKDIARQFIENDQEVVESGEPQVFDESLETQAGIRYYKTNIFPISGDKLGGVSVDITDEIESQGKLQKTVEEKETLLKEIHHRVKNNLAVVSGMLYLQWYKEEDERVQKKLLGSVSRIKTMASIHELLYQSSSFTHLKLDENVRRLIDGTTSTYGISLDIKVNYKLKPIVLNINQAIPFSLIINEAVTNVLKHAFDEDVSGEMDVTLFEKDGEITLSIEDDGKGLPDDFNPKGREKTLGLELIETLASQLKAEYSFKSLEPGTLFNLTFEREEKKGAGSSFLK